MSKVLRGFNVLTISFLILLEAISLLMTIFAFSELLLLETVYQETVIGFLIMTILILKSSLSLGIVLPKGFKLIYFKKRSSTCSFIISLTIISIINPLLTLADILYNAKSQNKIYILFKRLLQYISYGQTGLYLILIVAAICYLKRISFDEKESPLNIANISQGINRDLYLNIIAQGKDPDNERLKAEYRKLSEKRESLLEGSTTISVKE